MKKMSDSKYYPLNLWYKTDPLFKKTVDHICAVDNKCGKGDSEECDPIEFVKNNFEQVFLTLYSEVSNLYYSLLENDEDKRDELKDFEVLLHYYARNDLNNNVSKKEIFKARTRKDLYHHLVTKVSAGSNWGGYFLWIKYIDKIEDEE